MARNGGVQGPAGRDARGDLRGLGEGQGGGVLDRRGRRGPDLGADAEQGLAQPVAERAVGHPGGAEAPARPARGSC